MRKQILMENISFSMQSSLHIYYIFSDCLCSFAWTVCTSRLTFLPFIFSHLFIFIFGLSPSHKAFLLPCYWQLKKGSHAQMEQWVCHKKGYAGHKRKKRLRAICAYVCLCTCVALTALWRHAIYENLSKVLLCGRRKRKKVKEAKKSVNPFKQTECVADSDQQAEDEMKKFQEISLRKRFEKKS